MRRVNRCFGVFAAFFLTIGIIFYLRLRPQIDPTISTPNPSSSTKTILLYTPYFTSRDWELGALGSAPFSECPVSDCRVTDEPAEVPSVAEFDAVLFHLKVSLNRSLSH